ncbi:MAG: DUF1003 domain-containing protein [Chloroflexi bacterium]|nr:DUF1003 domain-containing protein [Chloroflexota bacterium]
MTQEIPVLARKRLEELALLRPAFPPSRAEIRNLNEEHQRQLTAGQRLADGVANGMGSWRFIIVQTCLLALWILFNVVASLSHWDAYPFILLNLIMSFQAAFAAPIIMMSQNRQVQKDRLAAEHDYQINITAENEIKAILKHLEYQDELILQILHRMEHEGIISEGGQPAGRGAAP